MGLLDESEVITGCESIARGRLAACSGTVGKCVFYSLLRLEGAGSIGTKGRRVGTEWSAETEEMWSHRRA
jgi:hypothetical protein